jgi:hypothetical protein
MRRTLLAAAILFAFYGSPVIAGWDVALEIGGEDADTAYPQLNYVVERCDPMTIRWNVKGVEEDKCQFFLSGFHDRPPRRPTNIEADVASFTAGLWCFTPGKEKQSTQSDEESKMPRTFSDDVWPLTRSYLESRDSEDSCSFDGFTVYR